MSSSPALHSMQISPPQSDFLNLSRWTASWLVVAEHTRNFAIADFSAQPSTNFLTKAFYFMTGFGHEAVMIFFVISGFLVGGKVWSRMRDASFTWRDFLIDRMSRLYAVLIVALLLGGALDWLGSRYFDLNGLYNLSTSEPIAVLSHPAVSHLGWRDFLINATFLQTIAGPTYGSNGPLWSLANEWWYYILFPCSLMVFFSRGMLAKTAALIATVAMVFFLPTSILILFGVWLLGVAASRIQSKNILVFGAVPLFSTALVLARLEVIRFPYWEQFFLGAGFALLLASFSGRSFAFPFRHVSRYLAGFSYSVYLVHFPVLMFVVSVCWTIYGFGIKMPFGPKGLCVYAVLMSLAIFSSWLVSLITEKRTAALRFAMHRVLDLLCAKK
jgi:peptidoglycan/LPS O-acetylase OafA/YrhL